MNKAEFANQLNRSWRILNHLKLAEQRNYFPDYSNLGASAFRSLSYLDVWKTCFAGEHYDFQLADNSLLQFRVVSFKPLHMNYVFLECPYDALTYHDYLAQNDFDPREEGDSLREDYGLYLEGCLRKDDVTPVRYDFDPENYREGLHPASHVHLGHENHIRISTKKTLEPVSFVLFVVRQFYPHSWSSLLGRKDAGIICRYVRSSLKAVPAIHFGTADEYEMHLT